MDDQPGSPAAVFVVSAWVEEGGRAHVRARITFTLPADEAAPHTAAAASPEQACRLLEEWWRALVPER